MGEQQTQTKRAQTDGPRDGASSHDILRAVLKLPVCVCGIYTKSCQVPAMTRYSEVISSTNCSCNDFSHLYIQKTERKKPFAYKAYICMCARGCVVVGLCMMCTCAEKSEMCINPLTRLTHVDTGCVCVCVCVILFPATMSDGSHRQLPIIKLCQHSREGETRMHHGMPVVLLSSIFMFAHFGDSGHMHPPPLYCIYVISASPAALCISMKLIRVCCL